MIKKQKIDTRTYDDDGFKKRAGCICFKDDSEQEILLVSSTRFPEKWIVPAGSVEPGESDVAAAVREIYEEAGVKGRIGRFLGTFETCGIFSGTYSRTSVYTLVVTEEFSENKEIQGFGVSKGAAWTWGGLGLKGAVTILSHCPQINKLDIFIMKGKTKKWFPVDEAISALSYKPAQRSYILKAFENNKKPIEREEMPQLVKSFRSVFLCDRETESRQKYYP